MSTSLDEVKAVVIEWRQADMEQAGMPDLAPNDSTPRFYAAEHALCALADKLIMEKP